MNRIVILSALCLFGFAPIPNTQWLLNFTEAKMRAKAEHKVILLSFSGSDWCAPCIKFKREVFETKEFLNHADSTFILVSVDFPQNKKNALTKEQQAHNDSLAARYNPKGLFPQIVVTDFEGRTLGSIGYVAGGCSKVIDKLNAFKQD